MGPTQFILGCSATSQHTKAADRYPMIGRNDRVRILPIGEIASLSDSLWYM
jgi:hypothetical protein